MGCTQKFFNAPSCNWCDSVLKLCRDHKFSHRLACLREEKEGFVCLAKIMNLKGYRRGKRRIPDEVLRLIRLMSSGKCTNVHHFL